MVTSQLHDRIIPLLERATHAVSLHMEDSLRELGITQAEAHILGALAQTGASSINDLHASFGHKRSSLTSILDRLEVRRLVERAPHPTSRRSVMIRLTPRGADAAQQVTVILDVTEAAVATRVSADDLEGFRRVIAALVQSNA
jgi:DNA-binding MarR family transcriptional regulator